MHGDLLTVLPPPSYPRLFSPGCTCETEGLFPSQVSYYSKGRKVGSLDVCKGGVYYRETEQRKTKSDPKARQGSIPKLRDQRSLKKEQSAKYLAVLKSEVRTKN